MGGSSASIVSPAKPFPWRLLFLLVTGFSAHASPADDCSPIDIRRNLPPALNEHFRNPMDQGSAGLCVPFVVADLLSVALGQPVSPFDMGYAAYSFDTLPPATGENSLVNGGPGLNPMRTFDAIQSRGSGVCPLSEMPGPNVRRNDRHGSFMEQMYELMVLQNLARRGYGPEEFRDFLTERDCTLGIESHINIPAAKIVASLVKHADLNLAHLLAALSEASCRNRRIEIPPEWFIMPVFPGDHPGGVHRDVDAVLQSGKPAGWGIDMRHLFKGLRGGHAMSIIGRHPAGKKCMYVVRNSWGRGCGVYKKRFRSSCNPKEGTFLVTREQLDGLADLVFNLETEPLPPTPEKPPFPEKPPGLR